MQKPVKFIANSLPRSLNIIFTQDHQFYQSTPWTLLGAGSKIIFAREIDHRRVTLNSWTHIYGIFNHVTISPWPCVAAIVIGASLGFVGAALWLWTVFLALVL